MTGTAPVYSSQAYDDVGAGEPPLVFLHGWCCERGFFAPQIAYFKPRHRIIVPDWDRVSDGEGGGDPPRLGLIAEALRGLVLGLRLKRPVIVGHSMGGVLALMLGASQELDASAIVLLDSSLTLPREMKERYRAVAKELTSPRGEEIMRSLIEKNFIAPADDPGVTEAVIRTMCSANFETAAGLLLDVAGIDPEDLLARNEAPLLYVTCGGLNSDCRFLKARRPEAEIAHISWSGHFVTLNAAGEINRLLDAFLSRLKT